MTEQEIKDCIRWMFMTTTEDTIDNHVQFIFDLLVQQGVTI
jgi:hypothetical protein